MKKILLALSLLVSFAAQAQTQAEVQSCVAATKDQSEQMGCVSGALQQSSRDLNDVYDQFQTALKDKQVPGGSQNLYYANLSDSLKMSERSWIQYQTNQCEFEGNLVSRKAYVLVTEMVCTNRINLERIDYLKSAMRELNLIP